jgi:hypothetical protein
MAMKIGTLLKKNFYKDELKNALYSLDLHVSGNINELVSRILKATKKDPEETLNLFYKDSLAKILEKHNLPKNGNKSDLIERIVVEILGEPIKKKKVKEAKKEEPVQIATENIEEPVPDMNTAEPQVFDRLVNDIENWSPHDRYRSEEGYRVDLCGHLDGKGYHARMEKGESRTDILIDEIIPIEIKKSPNKSEYRLAFGQIKDHCKAYGSCITVICDVKKLDEFEDFKEDLRDLLHRFNTAVIRK